MKKTVVVGGVSAPSGKMVSGVIDLGDTTIPVGADQSSEVAFRGVRAQRRKRP